MIGEVVEIQLRNFDNSILLCSTGGKLLNYTPRTETKRERNASETKNERKRNANETRTERECER